MMTDCSVTDVFIVTACAGACVEVISNLTERWSATERPATSDIHVSYAEVPHTERWQEPFVYRCWRCAA